MSTVSISTERFPEVACFLAGSPRKGLIDGAWRSSSNRETFATHDPGSGAWLSDVFAMQPEDVDLAVCAATRAFEQTDWATMDPLDRAILLQRWADIVEEQKPIIAQIESLDSGKVFAQAEGDVQNFVDTMRYFADLPLYMQRRSGMAVAHHEAWVMRHPWGPCGFIFPWNFPLLLFGWGTAPALAAGNTVVVKPAEDTSLSTLYVAHLAHEVGIPDGVINVVPGFGDPTGDALAKHPGLKRMSFTGSPEIGRLIGEACGANLTPVKLELGGKGAAVVFDDVDLDDTADKLVAAITFHAGQVCCTATRWLLHESICDELIDKCIGRLQRISIGYQLKKSSQMGPLINARQRDRVLGYLDRGRKEGAEVILEGGTFEDTAYEGFYVKPALMTGPLDNIAACDEIFGPVAYIASFRDEAEAIRMTNDTAYGLANSVWSDDLGRAARVAEAMIAGNSWINGHNLFPHGVPYAGINRSGLGGGVNSVETLFDYWRNQSVVRPLP